PLAIGERRRPAPSVPDEGADAPARLQHAGALQLAVDLGHRVRVDPQLDRELPDRRQLVARMQPPGPDRHADCAFELGIQGGRVRGIDREHGPLVLLFYKNSTSGPWGSQGRGDSAKWFAGRRGPSGSTEPDASRSRPAGCGLLQAIPETIQLGDD